MSVTDLLLTILIIICGINGYTLLQLARAMALHNEAAARQAEAQLERARP